MSIFQSATSDLSRRSFFKAALGAAAGIMLAAGIAAGALPGMNAEKAYAATGDAVALEDMVVDTEYTVSANLYVRAQLNVILGRDAYLTDLTPPNILTQTFPTTPQVDNATIVKNVDSTYTVTIDGLNDTFGLITIADTSSDGNATVTYKDWVDWNNGGHAQRIDHLEFSVTGTSGSYEFTATEYSNLSPFKADRDWSVTLQVDFNSVKVA